MACRVVSWLPCPVGLQTVLCGHGHWLGSLGEATVYVLQGGRVQCRAMLQGAFVGWVLLLFRAPDYVALEAMFDSWAWLLAWLPARKAGRVPQQLAALARLPEG